MASRLSDMDIAARLAGLSGWERGGDEIAKTFRFSGFRDAMGFVNRVAAEAEAADHHPDIDIRFNTVRLALSTHSAGGLTAKDFDLANRINAAEIPRL